MIINSNSRSNCMYLPLSWGPLREQHLGNLARPLLGRQHGKHHRSLPKTQIKWTKIKKIGKDGKVVKPTFFVFVAVRCVMNHLCCFVANKELTWTTYLVHSNSCHQSIFSIPRRAPLVAQQNSSTAHTEQRVGHKHGLKIEHKWGGQKKW